MRSDEFFPGSNDERVPAILTGWEACRVLRLDQAHGGNQERALRALRRIVEAGRLHPERLGKYNRYKRAEILRLAGAPPEN